MEIIALLQHMNRCFMQLVKDAQTFLEQSNAGDFERLTFFEETRALQFQFIENSDQDLQALIQSIPKGDLPLCASEKERIHLLIQSNQSLIQTLGLLDERIQLNIELKKSSIHQQIHDFERQSQQMKRFKSTWLPESGERLDSKL